MSRVNSRRLKTASNVQKELATPNVISRKQARLYSQAVRLEWLAGSLPTWKQEEAANHLSDAERLIEAGRILRDLVHPSESSAAYRRAGDLLEWLSRASGSADGSKGQAVRLALLAGAAFQLAGYPAMARGLLSIKQLSDAEGNIFAAFLRADFESVIRYCVDYWRDRMAFTGPDGVWSQNREPEADPSAELLSSELVRCLGLISQSLRINDQARLKLSLRKLQGLARVAVRSTSDVLWLTIALTADVGELYAESSLWIWIDRIRRDVDVEGQESLDHYVRNQFRAGRGLLWPSQQEGIRRLSAGTSFAMCTPTGSGKTTIAELAIVRMLYQQGGLEPESATQDEPNTVPLVLYLVPSRALAAEVEARLSVDIGSIDARVTVTGIYGGTDWSLTDRWLTATGPTVLICTVEMAETLLRYVGPILLRRLRLVIVDEAHQVQFDDSPYGYKSLRTAENRSARLEQFAARLFTNAPSCPAVALSAVAGGAEHAIAQWISRDTAATPQGQNYRSTRQLIGRLDCLESGHTRIRLELVDGKPLQLSGRSSEAYIPTPFIQMPRFTGRLRTDITRFVRCHSLWAAIQLARSGRIVLISITRAIEDVLCDFCDALKLTSWRNNGSNFYTPPGVGVTRHGIDLGQLYRDCLDACREYCDPSSYEARLLEQGIAVHHGQLPVRVRRLMTDVIRFNVVPITVATSTLTEGVNMPFDVIILPALVRKQPKGPNRFEFVSITVPEFLNLAGRAGRPGAGVEGITLVSLAVEPTSNPGSGAHTDQLSRINREEIRFNQLIHAIGAPSSSSSAASSPLFYLLNALWDSWRSLLPNPNRQNFLEWLEETDPASLPTGTSDWADLVDTLDSLDLLLISAIEEAENLKNRSLEGADLESYIRLLWSHTYARFAANETDWLERVFVTRAAGVRAQIYTDPKQRKQIYRLGLPPRRCVRFVALAETIENVLRDGFDFASWSQNERFSFLVRLGELLDGDSTFRINNARNRNRTPGTDWKDILRWWLRVRGAASPDASVVRDWLFVVTSDFDFRFGMSVNSTITNIWNRIRGDEFAVPTLEEWRQITGLPWAAFWLRDLLSWGTLEPVVAYLMAVNSASRIITTRQEAESHVQTYYDWHLLKYPESELLDDFFSPLRMSEWHREAFGPTLRRSRPEPENFEASLQRHFPGNSPERFSVIPCELHDSIAWLDAAGYRLAESVKPPFWHENYAHRRDFYLNIRQRSVVAHEF